MGLFDKLKSLVSDDKKDSGTIEIVAPLSGLRFMPVHLSFTSSYPR